MGIDKKWIKDFWSNLTSYRPDKKLVTVVLILIPLVLSVFFRVYPAYLPVTENWAENSVKNNIQNSILQQVNQQYPNLPTQQKQELARQQMRQMISDNPGLLEKNVKQGAEQLKSRLQDENGQTYLLAIDPYFYYRYYENKIETGHYYDVLKNGQPWDDHKLAPLGSPVGKDFHTSFGYLVHRVVSFFNSNIPPMTTFFYLPVLISALAIIPAFFIVKRKTGNFGAFVASTLLAVHTAFLGRTAGGFADTDAYNVFFPLLITWIFIEALETDNHKRRMALGGLAGVAIGLFSFAWKGWWYIFDFLLAMLVGYLGYLAVRHVFVGGGTFSDLFKKSKFRENLSILGVYVFVSALSVSLVKSFSAFTRAFVEPVQFTVIKDAAHSTLWPNVLTTVAELGNTSLRTIVNSVGGEILFFIAMLGVVLTMTNKEGMETKDWWFVAGSALLLLFLVSPSVLRMGQIKYLAILCAPLAAGLLLSLKRGDDVDVKYAIVLTVWFVGTIYASTKGMRFTLLLVPAFSVAFGLGIGMLHRIGSRLLSKVLNADKRLVSLSLIILLSLFLISPITSANKAAMNEVPSMNDAWWSSLEKIDQEAAPDAIVNSWWDFGHWFKAIADRAVTFDGGSQNKPMAHWIGKVLLTGDEDTAVGILRMLDCGSNNAFDELYNATNDTVYSVHLLNDVIIQDKTLARQRLENEGLPAETVDDVLNYTHCEPPENYFITSEDMVGKAGVWGHFGSWNFERAHIYENLRSEDPKAAVDHMVENFGYDEDKAKNLYYNAVALKNENQANQWIAPWPRYMTSSWTGCRRTDDNETMACQLGYRVSRQQGQDIVIETVSVELDNPDNTSVTFGAYDSSRRRVGESEGKPKVVTLAGEELESYELNNSTFPYGLLVDLEKDRIMLMDQVYTDSMFTRLFFLNGRYVEHFDKFSDKTGVSGSNIKIWKVDWPDDEDN